MSIWPMDQFDPYALAMNMAVAPTMTTTGYGLRQKMPLMPAAHSMMAMHPMLPALDLDPSLAFACGPTSLPTRPESALKARLRGVGRDGYLTSPPARRSASSAPSYTSLLEPSYGVCDDAPEWSVTPPAPVVSPTTFKFQNKGAADYSKRRAASTNSSGSEPTSRWLSQPPSPPPSPAKRTRDMNTKQLRVATMPSLPPKLVPSLSTDSSSSLPLTPVSLNGSVSPVIFDAWTSLPSAMDPKVPWQSPADLAPSATDAPSAMPFSFADLYNIGLVEGGDLDNGFGISDGETSPELGSIGLPGVESISLDALAALPDLSANALPTPMLIAPSLLPTPSTSACSSPDFLAPPMSLDPSLVSPGVGDATSLATTTSLDLFDPLFGLAVVDSGVNMAGGVWSMSEPPIAPLVRRQLGGGSVRGLSGQHATSFANVGPAYDTGIVDHDAPSAPSRFDIPVSLSPPPARERRNRKRARTETPDLDGDDRSCSAGSVYEQSEASDDDGEYMPGSPRGHSGLSFDGDFYIGEEHSSKRQRTTSHGSTGVRRMRPGPRPRTEHGKRTAESHQASLPPPRSPTHAYVSAFASLGADMDDAVYDEIATSQTMEALGLPQGSLSKDAIRQLYVDLPHDHRSRNKFACLIEGCGRTFPRRSAVESHIQTHLEDKPFTCPHAGCTSAFVRQHDLRRHERIHSGNKPHQCPCGKGFARGDALVRHRQRGICIGSVVPRRC